MIPKLLEGPLVDTLNAATGAASHGPGASAGRVLRQQAYEDIRVELRQDAEVVFFDAAGNPIGDSESGNGTSSGSN